MIQMRGDPRVLAKGLEKVRKAAARMAKRIKTVCEKRTRGGDVQ